MMVSAPETWVESMAAAGTDIYTFHVEATEDPKKTIRTIKEAGMKAGIGIKVQLSLNGKTSDSEFGDSSDGVRWKDLVKCVSQFFLPKELFIGS